MRQPKPFTLPHFRRWAAALTLDNGEPFLIEPFQASFLKDVFSGVPECWLVVPEENGKTTLISALALYHARFRESAAVQVAASSRDQGEILYRQGEGFVDRSELEGFRCLEGYRRIRYDDLHSRIQIFAADDRTGDGIIPTLCLTDELHRHRSLSLYRTWRGKLGKRQGQIVAISTAGEPGSEFEQTREQIRQSATTVTRRGCFGRFASPQIVLHEWAVPEKGNVEDMALVKRANPFSGVTVAGLREKFSSPTMTMEHWRRFVCNLPTRSDQAAIQEAEWFAAKVTDEIPPGTPIWLGLDVAWKWDTTAAVPFWLRDREFRLFGPATILTPPRDGRSLNPHEVEAALVTIHQRNPIHTVVMDDTRAEQLAVWISETFGAIVIPRVLSHPNAAQDFALFMEGLRNGWLHHAGDSGLTRHALNAIARVLPYGDARFDRASTTRQGGEQDHRVIDALTAAAMVHSVAMTMPMPPGPSVYETRPPLLLGATPEPTPRQRELLQLARAGLASPEQLLALGYRPVDDQTPSDAGPRGGTG